MSRPTVQDPGRAQRGFSLIEVVAFIVIMSVSVVALLSMYRGVLPRGATPAELTLATQLARERMELILGRRVAGGYSTSGLTDPCAGAAVICTDQFTTGSPAPLYSIVVVGINPVVTWSGLNASAVRMIGVKVLGPDGTTAASLSAVIANY